MPITPDQFEFIWTNQGWEAAIRGAESAGGVLEHDPNNPGQFSTITSPRVPLTPLDFSETFRNPYGREGVAPVQVSGDEFENFYSDGPIYDELGNVVGGLRSEPTAIVGAPVQFGGAIAGAGGLIAARALLRTFLGGGTRVTLQIWNRLPGWAQTALAAVGIGVGAELALDLGGIDDTGIIPGFGLPDGGLGMVMGIQVVGSWNANGVTFYRLATGQLAVQNKHGKWKLWRPKKPIVIYAGGAGDLSTYLRADKALDKQAKRLRKSLDRRAPRRKSSTPAHGHPDGTTITNVKA